MPLTAGTKLGQYEIRSPLGAGGMGEVYRARDTVLKRDVAIKVLPADWSRDPERLRRFELEAQAAAALNHPNIVSIFHVDQHDGAPYIVTELLQGETLREHLRKGPMRLREVLDYGAEIARGLAAAHDAGIIHRDLKPENLFVTKEGCIKILDFGVAKLPTPKTVGADDPTATVPQQTIPGHVVGTVGYMAPEQVRGQATDARSDIFAFGTVLYEMVTGKPTFRKPTSAETMNAILHEDPASLSGLVSNTPPGLQRVVHRCLEKNPELRFHSAHDLAFALEALTDTSASSGSAPSATAPPRPRSAMGPRLKWLAAVVPLCGLALALGWWYWNHRPPERGEVLQRQLTARTGDYPILSAVISRDGKYLAYSDNDGISIQEIATGETHRLPGTADLTIWDWYPDGLRLLVTHHRNELSALFAVTGEKRKIETGVSAASLSPDGSEIAFFRGSITPELWTMPTAGGEARVRFAIDKKESFLAAGWSPDGKSIAYVRTANGPDNPGILETRNLENGETRILLTHDSLIGRGNNNVSWLPAGRIVFELYKGSYTESDLWGITLSSAGFAVGKPFRITNTTGLGVAGLSASTDGKRLTILFSRESYSLFVANLSKTGDKLDQPRRLTNDYWNHFACCWTADSQTLFYQVTRNDQGQEKSSIYKRQISSDSTELFLTGSESYAPRSLNPDGAWVIATADRRVPGKGRLLRVPSSGGTPETILQLSGRMAQAHCATAGSGICILSEDMDKQQVFYTFDPIRGRGEEVGRIDYSGYQDWSLSPDGHLIALAENMSDSVRLFDIQNKQLQVIHPVPPQKGLQSSAWSADGKKLFITADTENGDMLLEMDLSGHTRVLLKNPWSWIGAPTPSPDGKRIAYTYGVGESNVTLLEQF